MVHAEQPENRTAYAFKPTNEKFFATLLVDRNDEHFLAQDIGEKPIHHSHRLEFLKLVCFCAMTNNFTHVVSIKINENREAPTQ